MAEIKSTIDLVMERTKGMVQSKEERAEAEAQEREKQARSLALKLREGELGPGRLPEVLADLGGEEGPAVRAALVKVLIEDLGLEEANEPLLTGLGVLAGDALGALLQGVRGLEGDYALEKERLAQEVNDWVLKALAAEGLAGSALRPKVEEDPAWAEGLARIKADFEGRLERLKASMRERLD